MNYPKWCQISPDFQKSLISNSSNFSSQNNPNGQVYLKSLGLSVDEWSADRIAFYNKNRETQPEYQVRVLSPSRQGGVIEVIIFYRDHAFSIEPGGQLITKIGGYKYRFNCLSDFPSRLAEIDSHYPLIPPTSSVPFEYRISSFTDLHNLKNSSNYPEIGNFQLAPQKNFKDIQVYCFDFDKTLTSCHLTGKIKEEIVNLIPYILVPSFLRWLFRFLIAQGKKIYIVTFSDSVGYSSNIHAGSDLISETLSFVFDPTDPQDHPVYKNLRIVAYYPQNYDLPDTKNGHLQIACRENNLKPNQCCLIDDNFTNTQMAIQGGFSAIHTPRGLCDLLL